MGPIEGIQGPYFDLKETFWIFGKKFYFEYGMTVTGGVMNFPLYLGPLANGFILNVGWAFIAGDLLSGFEISGVIKYFFMFELFIDPSSEF